MSIFGMGVWEILVILVIALIVFGPDKLPQVAGQVGRAVRDFRRMTSSLTAEFQAVTEELTGEFSELKAVTEELSQEIRAVQSEVAEEVRHAQETLRLDPGGPVSTYATADGYATSGAVGTATHGVTTMTNETPAHTIEQPKIASKDDPTADVSLLDMDELVVMTRTSRPLNGYQNGSDNGHGISAESRQRTARTGRRAAIMYQRPRSQVT